MNVERSPGGPQSEVRRYQQLEDGFFLYTRSTVNANGNPGFSQVAFKLDGKDYPLYSSGALAQFLTSGKLSAGIMTFTGRGSVDAVLLSLVVVPKAQVGGLD